MSDLVTTDTIISWLKEQVEQKNPVAPSTWLDSAAKLVVLLGDESDKLHRLQQRVAQMRVDLLKDPQMTVAKAKLITEATEEYRQMKDQESKISLVEEHVRISKIQARMRDNEHRLQ